MHERRLQSGPAVRRGPLRTGRAGPSLLRLREIAASVGISERRAHDIVVDLTTSGYLAKQCEERRNTREVQSHRPLGDDLADHRTIGDMLALLTNTSSAVDTAPADDSWIPWAPS